MRRYNAIYRNLLDSSITHQEKNEVLLQLLQSLLGTVTAELTEQKITAEFIGNKLLQS